MVIYILVLKDQIHPNSIKTKTHSMYSGKLQICLVQTQVTVLFVSTSLTMKIPIILLLDIILELHLSPGSSVLLVSVFPISSFSSERCVIFCLCVEGEACGSWRVGLPGSGWRQRWRQSWGSVDEVSLNAGVQEKGICWKGWKMFRSVGRSRNFGASVILIDMVGTNYVNYARQKWCICASLSDLI